jgi:purine catabolism regulator
VRPLTLRGAIEGYLILLGSRDDFTDFDYQVAARTASVLAIELAKQSAVVEARLRVQGDFLEELLDNPAPAIEQLSSRARALGYDLDVPHVVFVLRPRTLASPERAPGSRSTQRFADAARRKLILANVASLLREVDGGVQVLAPCPDGVEADSYDRVAEWVESVRVDMERAMAPDPVAVIAGVGRSPRGELTYYSTLREATLSAEIAATLPEGNRTLHFAHLGALRLIFQLAGNPELRSFQHDLLGPLEEYDRSHRSEFVQTLDAFFRAGGNHMQAARDLHVHRNTLIYRLDRIRELLGGAELEHPDSRLNLQLALKIRSAFGPTS